MRTGSRGRPRSRRLVGGLALIAALLVGAAGGSDRAASAQDAVQAGDEPLADVPDVVVDQARAAADEPTTRAPETSRGLVLNRGAMEAVLATAPPDSDAPGSLVLRLPAPDGSTATFDVWESAVMAPELAARYPEITTYSGQGVDDPAATIAFDLTPQGFHAQVLSPNGNWYIDPAVHLEDVVHESFYRSDRAAEAERAFIEENAAEIDELAAERPDPPAASRSSGNQLHTHRLAVAANSNYTNAFGGTQAGAQAAIVTAITRVNQIYQQELAIRLQLVGPAPSSPELDLIYESFDNPGGVCTPFTSQGISGSSGGNGFSEITISTAAAHGLSVDDVVLLFGTGTVDGTWAVRSSTVFSFVLRGSRFDTPPGATGSLQEWDPTAGKDCDPFNNSTDDIDVNQAVVDQVIGDASYDIGHVFTTGSGGVAGLGVVGVSDQKARGTTGLSAGALSTDEFFVDFVAHEIGHQYGGSHTFNGTGGFCSGNESSIAINRVEPGSGSTIQAYAGICGLDDLQNSGQASSGDGSNASDPYFHSRSIDQIRDHVNGTKPDYLPPPVNNGNTVPTQPIVSPAAIPAQTPFFIGATSTDGDGDTLTYHVEQRDGDATRPLSNPQITAGPLFRSFPPTLDNTSFFPRMADVASGNTNQNATCPPPNGVSKILANCWAQFLVPVGGPLGVGSSRTLNFTATVRDNRAGGGGVNTADTTVTVHNTGSRFRVLTPNGGETIAGATTVTWDPALTGGSPINAGNVSIRLSTDGGLTFPTPLATNVPNDGSQSVTMPSQSHTDARLMVHSGTYVGGSGFFDISDTDFTTTSFAPTAPSAPINPQGTPGDSEVVVTWSPPSSDGGSAITAYNVTASPGGATCGPTLSLSCPVTGLTNGVSYTFDITATNSVGTGPAATTPPVVPGTSPSAPLNPTAVAGDAQATVMWNPPSSDGGSGIASYTVTSAPDNKTCVSTGALSCVVTGLANGVSYTFDITATNASDLTGPAATTGAVVPTGPPSAPLNATATPGDGQANVSWSPPAANGGAGIQGYTVISDPPGGSGCTLTGATSCTVTGLTNGVNYTFDITATNFASLTGPAATTPGIIPQEFFPVPQSRIGNTRPTGKIGNGTLTGTPYQLNVHGLGGIPTSGVGAVSLNVTVDAGEQPVIGGGYITVYAHPTCAPGTQPGASNLNFHNPLPIANAVITPIDPTGNICIFVYGHADLLVDVNGWFPTSSDFTSVPQSRIGNTRPTGKIGNGTLTGTPYQLNVHGLGGIPTSGVGAVSLNVTVDAGEQPVIGGGYITVYAHPTCAPGTQPGASNLNFHNPLPIANAVITPIDPTGNICIFVYGHADLLVDVNGWFPTSSDFTSVPQSRIGNTRPTGKIGNGTLTGTPYQLNVHGLGGIPTSGVGAVSLNVTVDAGEQPVIGGGYITVYAHPTCAPGTQPGASNLNFHNPLPIANAVITPIDPTGNICIFVYGHADLLVDVNGWFPD